MLAVRRQQGSNFLTSESKVNPSRMLRFVFVFVHCNTPISIDCSDNKTSTISFRMKCGKIVMGKRAKAMPFPFSGVGGILPFLHPSSCCHPNPYLGTRKFIKIEGCPQLDQEIFMFLAFVDPSKSAAPNRDKISNVNSYYVYIFLKSYYFKSKVDIV